MNLTEDQFYEIACIIDSDFIGSRKTFTAKRKVGYNYLNSNRTDFSGFIKVYHELLDGPITFIRVMNDATDGWQFIHLETQKRIDEYLLSIVKP